MSQVSGSFLNYEVGSFKLLLLCYTSNKDCAWQKVFAGSIPIVVRRFHIACDEILP